MMLMDKNAVISTVSFKQWWQGNVLFMSVYSFVYVLLAARSESGRCRGVGGWQYRRDAAALRPDRRGSLRDAQEGLAAVIHPRGQSWQIGSLPSQSIAAARTASKMRRRVGVSSAISMTVPGWRWFRKSTNGPRGLSPRWPMVQPVATAQSGS